MNRFKPAIAEAAGGEMTRLKAVGLPGEHAEQVRMSDQPGD